MRTNEEIFLLRLLFEKNGSIAAHGWETRNLDWKYLVDIIEKESVAGVAHFNVVNQHIENKFPPDFLDSLKAAYHSNLRRNLLLLTELKHTLTPLHESNIPFMVIKGIALAEHIYPSLAMRSMSDTDILIRKEDLPRVDRILSSLGYLPRDSQPDLAVKNPEGYLSSLEYHREDRAALPVHLHWHLVNTSVPAAAFSGRIDMSQIWESALRTRVADVDSLILCPEHLIIYLCEHALRVGHSFDRLILVCDIDQAVRTYGQKIDWERLASDAESFGLSRFVYLALTIAMSYSSLDIPPALLERLRPPRLTLLENLFLRLQIRNRRFRGSSYLVYLAVNEGFFNKIRFIFRTFFPPSHILRQRSYRQGPKADTWLYGLRMKEVTGHLITQIVSFLRKKR